MRVDREEPLRFGGQDDSDAAEFEANAGSQRQHLPHDFALADHAHDGFGNVEEGERAEVPEVFLVGDDLADQATEQAGGGSGGHGEPFVGDQGGNSDDGAANRADDATAEQSHKEGAFEGHVGEAVGGAQEPEENAEKQGRAHEEHQLEFLVGIAFFREEDAAEGVPASQESSERRGHANLKQQRKDEVAYCQKQAPVANAALAIVMKLDELSHGESRSAAADGSLLLYWMVLMGKKIVSRQSKKSSPAGPRRVAKAALPTRYGKFTIYGFEGVGPREEAVALVRGKVNGRAAPLVRVHSQCLTGDVLTSQRCDCRAQLELSMQKIGRAASGILLYLPQEGRGIGLMNKLRAYELQDGGMDTVEANESLGFAADAREYDFPAKILKKLGATRIRLLSNNPDKVKQLESAGVRVVERVPCQPKISKISRAYLQTKKRKMGHLLQGI